MEFTIEWIYKEYANSQRKTGMAVLIYQTKQTSQQRKLQGTEWVTTE